MSPSSILLVSGGDSVLIYCLPYGSHFTIDHASLFSRRAPFLLRMCILKTNRSVADFCPCGNVHNPAYCMLVCKRLNPSRVDPAQPKLSPGYRTPTQSQAKLQPKPQPQPNAKRIRQCCRIAVNNELNPTPTQTQPHGQTNPTGPVDCPAAIGSNLIRILLFNRPTHLGSNHLGIVWDIFFSSEPVLPLPNPAQSNPIILINSTGHLTMREETLWCRLGFLFESVFYTKFSITTPNLQIYFISSSQSQPAFCPYCSFSYY